jgi:spermidine synthase
VAGGDAHPGSPHHPATAGPRSPPLRRLVLLFGLSGAAGLIHEVAWARALGQTLGGSLASQSIVLGVFLGGLGIGAAVAGRRAGRLRRPLRAYALIEAAVGVCGLAAPLLAALAVRLVEAGGPRVPDGAPLMMLRFAVAASVLIPGAVLMGTTFPILVRAWRADDAAHGIALLYGGNTLGGGFGALTGTFAALPLLGTRGTFLFGAALNLVAAAGAARLAASEAATAREARSPRESRPGATPGATLHAAAVVSGLVGAILQTGWTRVMTLSFGSSVYALGLTLGAVILGLGLGPLVVARLRGGRPDAPPGEAARRRAAWAAWTAGAAALAILPLLGRVPALAVQASGVYERSPVLALAMLFGTAALLLLAPAMAQGACLPLLATAAAGDGRSERAAGTVYALSTAGSVAGFLIAGFALLPQVGARRALTAAALTALALAVALRVPAAGGRGSARGRLRDRLTAVAAGIAPLLLLLLPGWDAASMSGGGLLYGRLYRDAGAGGFGAAVRLRGEVLYERDGGDGLVTVRRNAAGILSLQINGKTEASSGGDMPTQLLAGHLPLLLHGGATDALVIGLASGVSLGAAARHPLASLEVVEIARAVPEAARQFAAVNGGVLDDRRAHVVIDDARAWLLARPRQWDVIASQPSNPWVAGVAGLFTTDMYRLLRARLRPGGIVAQWVQAYRIAPDDLRGVVGSFLSVFPDATLWEESPGGGDLFLVGGLGGRGGLDPARLAKAPAAVWTDLARAGVSDPADLLARFVAGPVALAAFSRGARPHTDDNLYLEWRAPLALFADAPVALTGLLRREREPVASILAPGALDRDPALAAELGARLRQREERIEAAASLRDADLIALREPGLAAGLALLTSGRFAEAAAALAPAAAAAPESAAAQFLLGQAYRGAGLRAPAGVAYQAAVAIDPGLADAWNALGLLLLAAGDSDRARAAFESAVRADPRLASARNNLGSILLHAGDLDGAAEWFRTALVIDPGLSPALANQALVARRRGDAHAAEAGYRAAIAADPLNNDARFNLAVLLAESGRKGEAQAELHAILAADPADTAARALLAAPDPGARGPGAP